MPGILKLADQGQASSFFEYLTARVVGNLDIARVVGNLGICISLN